MNTSIKLGAPICMLFVLCIVYSTGINSSSRFIVKKNKRVAVMAKEQVATESVMECAIRCYSSWNCNDANYFADNKTCYFLEHSCGIIEDTIGWTYLRKPPALFLHITNTPETWDGAKSYCESIGGGLANIIAPSDYDMIMSILDPSQNTNVWIGGSDRVNEGDWIWSNGCRFSDQGFSLWGDLEPNNYEGREHCLDIMDSKWNDAICTLTQTFVCEI